MNAFIRAFAIGVTVAMLLRLAVNEFNRREPCPRCGFAGEAGK